MALRKITVVSSTKSQPTELYSEATTFGQLKDVLNQFGSLDKLRAVVKESRATLEMEEAILPEGEFTLFLTPKQIKAGAIDIAGILSSLRDKISEAIDEVIEGVEDGEFGEDEAEQVAPVKKATNQISAEDQAILNQLASMK